MERRGLVGRLQRMRFDNYRCDCAEQKAAWVACRVFSASPTGSLLLLGNIGTGKTHLGAAICHEAAGTYTTIMKMIRYVREAWTVARAREQDHIDHYSRARLLVIDEVGVQYGTQAERLLAYEVINDRYVAGAPTVVISNETQSRLVQSLGARVMDRLEERSQTVCFTWNSYRVNAANRRPRP